MFGLGAWEIALIIVLALVFLGPKKLPEVAKSLGKGLRSMRRAMDSVQKEVRDVTDVARAKPPPAAETFRKPEHDFPYPDTALENVQRHRAGVTKAEEGTEIDDEGDDEPSSRDDSPDSSTRPPSRPRTTPFGSPDEEEAGADTEEGKKIGS